MQTSGDARRIPRIALVCAECGAPLAPLMVDGGGVVRICSRRGCAAHMLDLTGVNA